MSAGFGASDVSAWFQDLPSWGKAAAIGGVGLALYIPYKFLTSRPRKSPYKEDFTPGVVYLYQFPRAKHVPNISNYCLKLETWLRLADISYEIVPIPLTVRSREGTLPFVELDGVEYHDSTFAIRDLSVALNKTSMEDHLTAEQKAICRAFEKMTELSFNISHIPCRIEHVKEIFNTLPPSIFGIFYPLVAFFFQSSTASRYGSVLAASGYGKHTRAEQIQIGCDDLKAISAYVGNKHFFTGFKPTRIDACLFGILAQIVYAPYENEHTEFIRTECPNLIEYVNRIKTRVWPDWVECTTKFSTETQWKKRGPASNPGSINGSLPGSQLHSPRS